MPEWVNIIVILLTVMNIMFSACWLFQMLFIASFLLVWSRNYTVGLYRKLKGMNNLDRWLVSLLESLHFTSFMEHKSIERLVPKAECSIKYQSYMSSLRTVMDSSLFFLFLLWTHCETDCYDGMYKFLETLMVLPWMTFNISPCFT